MSIVDSASRAPRLALHVPVRVRRIGAAGWESGQALNLSRSGLLVAVRGSYRCHETIEAIVELSQATAGVGDPEGARPRRPRRADRQPYAGRDDD